MLATILLWLAATAPAEASAELVVRAKKPIVVLVDGKPARLQRNLVFRAADLAPGKHEVTIKNLIGKTVHEEEIDVPDETLVEAAWVNRELQVSMSPIPGADLPEAVVAEAPFPPEADEPDEAEEGEEADELEIVERFEPEPAPEPEPVEVVLEPIAEVPVAAAPIVVPEPAAASIVPAAAVTPAPPAAAPNRRVRLEVEDGTAVELRHGAATVHVEVRGGEMVITDGAGLVLTVE